MGAAKDELLEQDWLDGHLCPVCQDRHRTARCWRCDELTVCQLCLEQGASRLCDYCKHVWEQMADD